MSRSLRIRVLGAGVAGLAASIALAADGHDVELIDEHFEVPSVGTALGMFRSAQQVLRRLEVLDAVREVSAAPRSGSLRGIDGRVIVTVPAGDTLLVARSDLVRILQEAVPGTVRTSSRRVDDVRPLREDADLLLGADGVHSLVRRSGWPGAVARSHGLTVLRGTADIEPPEVTETWGGGWLVGITPLAGTEGAGTNWFACVPEHRTSSVTEDLAHLRAVIGDRRGPIGALLEAVRPETTLVHGIHTAPPVLPVRQDVALLGDAAHAMAPHLGHGANTALEDADALAAALRDRGSVPAALRTYARRRAPVDQAWRLGSAAMMSLAMADERAGLRDRVLRGFARLSPL
ncbi:FAD-dependent monooxygenase [Brachybacterium sacelli]|uniref:2-polyprenyl-6-methoxyphenol hydroxylase-like FAD-dependent oxidoreductase n=1 Tax=Brachybacterium sacelli TaxID=173364 RepID=A0ABS4X1H0_9MICO|nr:FAD-dependent monooxygenase [Brachybacterium sacelli]MBP2382300.1 2-polyprenyl-6-methoxyphenol hydroxylase-like FAD-dependent oxidoreductase [Brachybacterium sacelli]